jgi:hypothetical protein
MKKLIAQIAIVVFVFAIAAPSYAAFDKDPKAPKTETKKADSKKADAKKDCPAGCKDAKGGSSCCGDKKAADKK